jgi:hypothetical protein
MSEGSTSLESRQGISSVRGTMNMLPSGQTPVMTPAPAEPALDAASHATQKPVKILFTSSTASPDARPKRRAEGLHSNRKRL